MAAEQVRYKIMVMLIMVLSIVVETKGTHIILVYDEDFYETFGIMTSHFPYAQNTSDGGKVDVKMVMINVTEEDTYITILKNIRNVTFLYDVRLMLGIGSSDLINAVSTASEELVIPSIVYCSSKLKTTIYKNYILPLHPGPEDLGCATSKLVGQSLVVHAYLICQDTLMTDGFLNVFTSFSLKIGFNESHRTIVSTRNTDYELRLQLLLLHDAGFRLVVVHCDPEMLRRIVGIAQSLHYYDRGFAWILSEAALDKVSRDSNHVLPQGLLAIEGYEMSRYGLILNNTVHAILRTINQFPDGWMEGNTIYTEVTSRPLSAFSFIRSISSDPTLFDKNGRRSGLQFRLLNYVKGNSDGVQSHWKTVGYILDGHLDLETVVWPGQTIFGPVGHSREHYTIVTRPAEPFVFIRGPVASAEACVADTACLKMHSVDAEDILTSVESFKTKSGPPIYSSIYCCDGIVIDVLNTLAAELEFDFLIYFHNDTDYGTFRQGYWTGMIGDIVNETADIAVGALSITADRLQGVTFTEPFFYSSFNMLSVRDETYTSYIAFLLPFAPIVWVLIMVSATAVAVATSIFEWNSPFGLNPWGKRRRRNYTLGSALTMVFSVWFGHTISTKSPKSWPSKVTQNFWAAMAIFIIASYTANLAAYLAGNTYEDSTYNILDTKLSTKRLGVIPTSAVKEYVRSINNDLYSRLAKFYVDNIEDGINDLRNGNIDLYMDDSPILEYALSHLDTQCSIKYAAHSFGDNAYAFGLKKGSWLKAKLDPLLLTYMETGLVENLKWRYYGRDRHCDNQMMSSKELKFGLQHTGGLFVMLAVAVGFCFVLMIGEYVIYFYVVPRLRNASPDSIWKSRHMEYFSQRLYRVINSEKVKPPVKQLANMVKRRQLYKVFKTQGKVLKRNAQSLPSDLSSIGHLQNNVNLCETNGDATRYRKLSHSQSQIELVRNLNKVYTISSSDLYQPLTFGESLEVIDEMEEYNCRHLHSQLVGLSLSNDSNTLGIENPVFEDDDEDDINDNSIVAVEMHKLPRESITIRRRSSDCYRQVPVKQSGKRFQARSTPTMNSNTTQEHVSHVIHPLYKRCETWPSPGKFKRSIKGRTENKIHTPRSFSSADETVSITNEARRLCQMANRGEFELKDNIAKSSVRRHAMSSRSNSDSAVESLSKEDLLILWKKSEIDLQTRLNRSLSLNSHLRKLLRIVDEQSDVVTPSDSSQTGKTSFIVSTRL